MRTQQRAFDAFRREYNDDRPNRYHGGHLTHAQPYDRAIDQAKAQSACVVVFTVRGDRQACCVSRRDTWAPPPIWAEGDQCTSGRIDRER